MSISRRLSLLIGLVTHASQVMRLNAILHDFQTGVVTPFRVWYDPGAAGPPLAPSLATSLTQKENS